MGNNRLCKYYSIEWAPVSQVRLIPSFEALALTRTLVLSVFIFYSKSHYLSQRRTTDHECSNAIQAASLDADDSLCSVSPCRSKDDLADKPWILESEYATGKLIEVHFYVLRLNMFLVPTPGYYLGVHHCPARS